MPALISRELYMHQLRPFMDTDIIKVVTGIRRAGKSTLLELAAAELRDRGEREDAMMHLNLESFANARYADLEFFYEAISSRIPKAGMLHVFLDEVQEVEGWEKVINSLQIDFPNKLDIYLTGSNSKLLSSELATLLSGRYVEIKVYPFSFAEFLDLIHMTDPSLAEADAFSRYLKVGGIPALSKVGFDEEASIQYLQSIYDTILVQDVFRRHEIRNPRLFDDVMRYAVANAGHTFSAAGISRMYEGKNIRVAPATIAAYMDYATESNFLVRARREDAIKKKLFISQEKCYLADHGFRQALYGRNSINIDLVLENIVFIELVRWGWTVNVGAVEDREVDFIGTRESERVYIQVSYLLADEKTRTREFRVLEQIHDNYPKYVLSLDEIPQSRDGIIHMNLRKFLLSSPLRRR